MTDCGPHKPYFKRAVSTLSLEASRTHEEDPVGRSFRSYGGVHHDNSALEDRAEKARECKAMKQAEVMEVLSEKEDYEVVLKACAQNVKMGPWKATSGQTLPYYLNATTNMMDKTVSHRITRMCLDVIAAKIDKFAGEGESLLILGMEAAGGMMVCQLAAVAPITHPGLLERVEFVYVRKARKTSGTCQQLEGPMIVTDRKPDSPPWNAIWLDDANSTGGSLRDGVLMLVKDYNIHVHTALYLVDRAEDRISLPVEKMGLADPALDEVEVTALYALKDIDALTPKLGLEAIHE